MVESLMESTLENRPVIVALDESAAAKAALEWAARYARLMSQPLRAVNVLELGVVGGSGIPGLDLAGAGMATTGIGAAGQMAIAPAVLGDPAATTRDPTPPTSSEASQAVHDIFNAIDPEEHWTLEVVAGGDVGKVLLDRAADAELLVIGTGEHTGVGRLLSGSVSHFCLSHAVIPITAVPAPAGPR